MKTLLLLLSITGIVFAEKANDTLSITSLPEGADELLADYFAPAADGRLGALEPLAPPEGPGVAWHENAGLPRGMVARVQWSDDLALWRESGETVGGQAWYITVGADGQRRTARFRNEASIPGPAGPVFLRVVVTAPENAPSRLLH